jgi:hypothetical protein
MPRNFDRRIEVVAPIEDTRLHERVCSLLETCLADNRQAWDLFPDGTYVQRKPGNRPVVSTHERLLVSSWGTQPFPEANSSAGNNGADGRHPENTARLQSAAPTSSS